MNKKSQTNAVTDESGASAGIRKSVFDLAWEFASKKGRSLAVISAHAELTPNDNYKRLYDLSGALCSLGFPYIQLTCTYTKHALAEESPTNVQEHCVLTVSISKKNAIDLAVKFGQRSLLWKDVDGFVLLGTQDSEYGKVLMTFTGPGEVTAFDYKLLNRAYMHLLGFNRECEIKNTIERNTVPSEYVNLSCHQTEGRTSAYLASGMSQYLQPARDCSDLVRQSHVGERFQYEKSIAAQLENRLMLSKKTIKESIGIPPHNELISDSETSQRCREHIQEARTNATTATELSKRAMQHHPGSIVYQKDSKFTPISVRNFGDFKLLLQDDDCTYTIDPQRTAGFVFANEEVARNPSLGLFPAMRLALRESGIKGYKQAYQLRIRQTFATKGVATSWYLAYVDEFGGIVSDFDHLEGGKCLWKSFVRTALDRGLRISLVDTGTGVWKSVDRETPETDMWSSDSSKRRLILVLEKACTRG